MTFNTAVDVISGNVEAKKFIKRRFPHIDFEAISTEAKLWYRVDLAQIYSIDKSQIAKDIESLKLWQSYDGTTNYLGFAPQLPLNFEQGFYLYLLRLWMDQQRFCANNSRPMRKVFVRDYLSYWQECENGYYMPRLEEFCNVVNASLLRSGRNITIREDYKSRLEAFMAANQGKAALLSKH